MEGEDAWQLRRDGSLGCYWTATRCPLEHGWVVTRFGVTEYAWEGSREWEVVRKGIEYQWLLWWLRVVESWCGQEIWVSLSIKGIPMLSDFLSLFTTGLRYLSNRRTRLLSIIHIRSNDGCSALWNRQEGNTWVREKNRKSEINVVMSCRC
jgi:hypothetical protein